MLAAAAVVAAAACGDSPTDLGPGATVAVRMSVDSADLRLGRTLQLSAFAVDSSGAFRAGRTVTWSSSAPNIASVDAAGLVTGAATGTATVSAEVDGVTGRAAVRVAPAPRLAFTRDSLGFSAQAGGSDPPPDSVGVENQGGFTLEGLTVDSISYGTGATDWLVAALDSAEAPATLTITPLTAGVTAAGTYTAAVHVSGTDADGSPGTVQVTLAMGAGPAAQATSNDGDAQTTTVGTAVPTPPSVLVADAFGNPAAGGTVVFAVTGGGGSVTGDTVVSDAQGIARVGSWTLGMSAGANALTGTLDGATSVMFAATGVADAAAAVAASAGDGQSALAGSDVAVPPQVLVADQFGNPVGGVAVTFAVASGGGSITGGSATSDGAGLAAVGSWTLGSPGPNTLTATSAGLAGSPVTFTANGLVGNARNLVLDGGDAQTDTAAAVLAVPYAVRVTDSLGNGVEGIPVGFSVTGGGGTITMSDTTDMNGVASAVRTLGTVAGTQTAQAAVGGLTGSPVTFTATATAASAASVAMVQGNNQSATVNTAVAVDPAVIVTDQFGNPVAGHNVTFAVTAGGGAVDPGTAIATGAGGTATVTSWTLGTVAGTSNNSLTATAAGAGLSGNPRVFGASATADAAAAIAIFAGDAQTATSGSAVPTDPAAAVTDQFGNPVSNETVTFAVTGGGGAVTGATPTTNGAGVATVGSWTVRMSGTGDTLGRTSNTLQASINGGAQTVNFGAFGIYSYAAHVDPIWGGSGGCTGCHGGTSDLTLSGGPAASHGALVDVVPFCDGTLGANYARVRSGGGTQNTDDFSILMRMVDTNLSLLGACNTRMPGSSGLPAATRDTIRGWIRAGALNN